MINLLYNVPTSLNNLKAKVNDLDVGKLKTIPVNLRTLIPVVDNEVFKDTNVNTLKTRVDDLEKIFPDGTTLIYIKQ